MNRHFTLIQLSLFLLCINLSAISQSTGDYRSKSSGDWSLSTTWERYDGANWINAPGPASSAVGIITIRSPHTILVTDARTADQLIVDAGATVNITSTLTVDDGTGTDVTVNGTLNHSGILGGSGSMLINGLMNWTGGSLQVNLTIALGATLTMSGGGNKAFGSTKTLLNQGTINWTGGVMDFNGGTLQNQNVFNISIGSDAYMSSAGTNLLDNTASGTITKTGASTFSIHTPATNAGTININSGILNFANTTIHTGTINAASGSTFQNSGNFSDGGTINISSATFTNSSGTFTQNQLISFTGTVTANNPATWNVNVAQTLSSTGTLNHSGNLTGIGSILINGAMNWTSGALNLNLTIASGATLTMSSGGNKAFGSAKTLLNQGTINWTGGVMDFNSGTLQNQNAFNINIGSDAYMSSAGTNLLDNTASGTITKTGASTFSIHTPATNAGTININSGNLNFANTTTHTGTINAASGSTFQNSGNFNDGGTINISSATFTNSSGTFTQNQLISFTGTVTTNNPATWNVNVAQTLSSTATLNHSGVLGGSGSLVVNGSMNWTAGSLNLNLTIASVATLTMSSGGNKAFGSTKTLLNQGTINWTGGVMDFNGGTLQNQNVFNISIGSDAYMSSAGTNLLDNTASGTITKTGASTFSIHTPATNAGTININSGNLNFANTTIHTGTINAASGSTFQNSGNFTDGGTINISSATFTNSSGTFTQNQLISFTGTVTANNPATWNVNVAQTLSSTATLNHSGNLTGIGSILINGTMNWTSGALNLNLTIASGATLTMTGGGNKAFGSTKTLLNQGTINWTGGVMDFNSGTLQNQNIFNISIGSDAYISSAGTNLLDNTASGTITKTGASTFSIHTPATNAGIIRGVGTLNFGNTFTNNGSIAPGLSPGILTVDGTQPFSASSTLSIEIAGNGGAGQPTGHDQLKRASDLIINGNLTVVETGTVPDGDYTIILLTSGTITGTFSSANLPVNYSVIYNSNNVVVRKGTLSTWYRDFDGDGFGDPNNSTQAAQQPAGYVANNSDCNDGSASINPNTIWYLDADNDNYYTGGGVTQCVSPGVGYKMSGLTGGGDCNDNNTGIHPSATEVCDGVDNDCDGQVDEGVKTTFYQDADGDGFGNPAVVQQACSVPQGYVANNTDCNDNNANFHPGATEVCNGFDDDCDGQTDEGAQPVTWYQDLDGDGYGNAAVSQSSCTQPNGYVANNRDCNDNNINVHPGATEVCNGIDEDCDGQIDEGVKTTFYRDADGDGFGNAAVTQQSCSVPQGYVANSNDCNDGNAAINPNTVWYLDADNDNYYIGSGVTQCVSPGVGYKMSGLTGSGDCNDNNVNIHPGATEICNNADDDCDGQTDEGAQPVTWYQDIDGDGYGNAAVSQSSCTQPNGYVLNNTDCNDNNVNVYPGATEVCNGIDDDCDGQTDEGVTATFYQDADGDGFGNAAVTQQACSAPNGYVANSNDCNDGNAAINPNTIWYLDADNDNYYTGSGVTQCVSPGVGYKMSGLTGVGDCNDNNVSIHPGATEICNNVDDDCDGQTDEGVTTTFYQDADGDGFGNAAVTQQACSVPQGYVANSTDCNDGNAAINPNTIWYLDSDNDNYYIGIGVTQCTSPGAGYKISGLLGGSDCNDNNVNIHPGAVEICNNIDDDCDGQIDEGAQPVNWYQDADGDGFGNLAVSQSSCTQPNGYVLNNTDCNDNNINVHPGATEICNAIDDDCDGQVDEAVKTTFYQDADGDGFGNLAVSQSSCTQPNGYVLNNTDCNDNNINVHPGATEVCNNIDDDCDGQTDEGVTTTFYRDSDGDGFGNPAITQQACSAPQGYVSNSTDCNDNNLNVHLGATEVCGNGIDDDCDGQTDEGCQPNPDNDGDGYTIVQGDCNDNNAAIHPGATEICGNNIDDNCNGYTDENCLNVLPILSSRSYPVKEGDAGTTFFEVEVKLDRPARVQLRLNYATANEDAIAGLDYVGTNGVLIIPVGGVSGIIRVGIIGDRLGENIERFNLNFSNPINVILPKDAQSRIMILDDDKGKNTQRAEMENSLTEAQPVFRIPNMVRKNNVWTIPGIERIENEVMVVNAMGQLIFKVSNYKNSVSIGNVATGIYFYRIKVREKDNSVKYYTGRLLITE